MLQNFSYLVVVLLIYVQISCVVPASQNHTLQLVHVFFRHGSRTPELHDTYPGDPYKYDTFSPPGWGQLTNEGKQTAFNLGRLLRRRYDSFLGNMYDPEIVKAHSTDFDRTKMTALLVLAGLFAPSLAQTWNENIPWMPIPYHYEQDNHDYTLRRPTKYCPAYVKELENVLASNQVQHLLKSKRKLLQYISKHAKKPVNKLIDVFGIYQTLNAEQSMNLTLPEWTKSVYPEEIHTLAGKQCNFENYNSVLKRLNGGRMLGKIINNMINKSTDNLSPVGRKIFLYSAHENNVINILAALNLFQPHVPKYSAAVIVELHYIEHEYVVKVSYSRDVNAEPEVQTLEGCETFCPLADFIEITKPHVPVNYTAECQSPINLD